MPRRRFCLVLSGLSRCAVAAGGTRRDGPTKDAGARDGMPVPGSASVGGADVPMATDVISKASASWDARPAVVTSGAVNGAALRARSRARLAADRSAVTVLQDGTARELGERLCQAVVPARVKETPLALYRIEGKSPRLYLAWSPTRTPKPSFHVPEAFGTLLLE